MTDHHQLSTEEFQDIQNYMAMFRAPPSPPPSTLQTIVEDTEPIDQTTSDLSLHPLNHWPQQQMDPTWTNQEMQNIWLPPGDENHGLISSLDSCQAMYEKILPAAPPATEVEKKLDLLEEKVRILAEKLNTRDIELERMRTEIDATLCWIRGMDAYVKDFESWSIPLREMLQEGCFDCDEHNNVDVKQEETEEIQVWM